MTALSCQVEDWRECRAAMEWLWTLHWDEVANDKDKVPLDLNIEEYEECADRGFMHCVTVRENKGKIVGYHWSIVRPHLHYKQTLCAFQDIYFIHPDYRNGTGAGLAMFRFAEQTLKERGVQKLYGAHKIKLDLGEIFEYLGWKKSEIHYTKYIGG